MKAYIEKEKCPSSKETCQPLEKCPKQAIVWCEDEKSPFGAFMMVEEDKCDGCGNCVPLCCGNCIEIK